MTEPKVNNLQDPEQKKSECMQTPSRDPSLSPAPISIMSRIWNHMMEPVRTSAFTEFELLLLTFCTGIQDAISFPDYHCFASNQTGNTVFLMLAIILPHLNGEMFILENIGAALGFFLLGGWLTGQLSHIVGPRVRLWLISCNFVQSCLVFIAAAMQYMYGTEPKGTNAVIVISLLAFASGSQVVQSRSFQMTEISTAMATAAWMDLMIDPRLFKFNNRPRTRRVLFLGMLILGSLTGAGIYRTVGSWVAILVSAAGKMLVTGMYFFNGAEKPKTAESQNAC
ncbi:uncharacterized protein GGS25DRAFT_516764 [Hypoxylon fragiforme]|uniref:uncharacterized protein n=1 Tax=Hypoxylon fragiforme TaxID=63214 RepID=UPI0020C604CD|nr:uncharacterized protein GGS25DRAFT_516764 [Hypoxylon fragiforme]KAI2613905.1 hypothetical protein GGS25DRAFT_516764 [Hypoxylon fragiforme]